MIPFVDRLSLGVEVAVEEVDVIAVGVDCHRALVACPVMLPATHHLSGEVVCSVDYESVGHCNKTASVAGRHVDGHSDIRYGELGKVLPDLIGIGVCPIDRIGAPGRLHRAYRHVGREGELREVVHCRSGGIETYGAEISADSCHGVAHTYGPCGAKVVVLAESQSVVHRLSSCGNRRQHQGYCDKGLFHLDKVLIV